MDGGTWELTRGVDFGAGIASFRNRCYTKASETGMNATVNVGFKMPNGEWLPTKDYDEQLRIADPRLRDALEQERDRLGFAWYGLVPDDGGHVLWAREPSGDLFAVDAADFMAAVEAGTEPEWEAIEDQWATRFPNVPEPPPLVVKVRFFVHDNGASTDDEAERPTVAA